MTQQVSRTRSERQTTNRTGNRTVAVGDSLDSHYSRKFKMNVTGNLRDLFTRLELVGNDPYPYSSPLAPSLVFADVDFSGV